MYNVITKDKRKKQGGFTLVELVVVITIMVILLGLGVAGVSKWTDWVNFKRQNEYAQTIFISMQNQLSRYSENGLLAQVQQKLSDSDGNYYHVLSVDALKDEDGNAYDMASIFSSKVQYNEEASIDEAAGEASNFGRYEENICYIIGTAADYTEYKNSGDKLAAGYKNSITGMNAAELNFLYDILDDYVYDPSILNAAVCVEFTVEDGQVFSALYSDRADYFSYDKASGKDSQGDCINICDRQTSARKKVFLGYYGVDTLSKATNRDLQKPIISNVKLKNAETLELSFKLSKVQQALNQLYYEIKIVNDNTGKDYASINIDGSELKNNESVVKAKVLFYDGDDISHSVEMKFPAWLRTEKKETYVVLVLDAVDIAESLQYTYSYNKLDIVTYGEKTSGSFDMSGYEDVAAIEKAYDSMKEAGKAGSMTKAEFISSFVQKMMDSTIHCTVQGSGDLYKTTAVKKSNTEHAYFASVDTKEENNGGIKTDVNEIKVSNARHLYNVRYVESLLDAVNTAGSTGSTSRSIAVDEKYNYVLTKNIIWSTSILDDSSSDAKVKGDSGMYEQGYIYDYDFTFGASGDGTTTASEDGTIETIDSDTVLGKASSNLFPAIGVLNSCSSFSGKKNDTENYCITGLRIKENSETKQADSDESIPLGLFGVNKGTIENVNLDQIKVIAADTTVYGDCVGAFCGINEGTLRNLEVKNSTPDTIASEILGINHVGGICGTQGDTDISVAVVKYDRLVNRAKVLGSGNYIGGIIGDINSAAGQKIEITNCKNYGQIRATKRASKYIGGIIGFANNSNNFDAVNNKVWDTEDKDNRFIISGCSSSPQYSDEEITALLKSDKEEGTEAYKYTDAIINFNALNGYYVGGIAGYSKYAIIQKCDTKMENYKQGYVIGNHFVGGIVGVNEGYNGCEVNGDSSKEVQAASAGISAVNVIGNTYVGGVAGVNALTSPEDTKGIIGISEERAEETGDSYCPIISNWIYTGTVVCVQKYVGGIVGYNTGKVRYCTNQVNDRSTGISDTQAIIGDYAGGVAGYNNGDIIGSDTSSDAIEILCHIGGRNFVGGVVGYNDVDGNVENYKLVGGYVEGWGSFVGGFAGLNASEGLLTTPIYSNPNSVTGKYCVGGIIGGNIVPLDNDKEHDVAVEILVDNFLGTVSGDAAVGGVIGYNLIVEKNDDNKSTIYNRVQAMVQALATDTSLVKDGILQRKDISLYEKIKVDQNGNENENGIETDSGVYAVLNGGTANGKKTVKDDITYNSQKQLTIKGIGDSNTKVNLAGVTAKIFVGGVIGYNHENSKLYVKNIYNMTPITAKNYIMVGTEQIIAGTELKTYNGDAFAYSYAGGIIGKVTKLTTIDNCSNIEGGVNIVRMETAETVDGKEKKVKATYSGGISEINEGIIKNCSVSNIGDSVTDYVGGITGLNKVDAKIESCLFQGTTVTGKSIVGGIAAENYGTISNLTIGKAGGEGKADENANVISVGESTGGIAGRNYGTIELSADKCITLYISVNSVGDNVGGVTGWNEGNVTAGVDGAILKGSIYGNQYVGGFIGKDNKAGEISNLLNASTVTAANGIAGGIVGEKKEGSIKACANIGLINADKSEAAGGIVANNGSDISDCGNYGAVISGNGNCGGITSINSGTITNCVMNVNVSDAERKQAVWEAEEKNIPWWCSEESITKKCPSDNNSQMAIINLSGIENVGGICAENTGNLINVYSANLQLTDNEKSKQSYIGGIAGKSCDAGIIELSTAAVDNVEIKSVCKGAYLGGITGLNDVGARISVIDGQTADTSNTNNITVRASSIEASESAGYANIGGAAGVNKGSITNVGVCADIKSKYGADGYGYGGIAGVNISSENEENAPAVISGCSYSAKENSSDVKHGIILQTSADNPGYIGGISGINYGQITESKVAVFNDTYIMTAADGYGYVGGMIGLNYGSIKNCDNSENDKILIVSNGSGDVGGIVGHQMQGAVATGEIAKDSNGVVIKDSAGNEVIKKLSTGKKWSISADKFSNDCGCGGILGYSASGQDISYTYNYAKVEAKDNKDLTAGGFIGRLENRERTNFKISNCENHGEVISGGGYVGGFIGRIKYYFMTFEKCANYGYIHGGSRTGGLLGSIYQCDSNYGAQYFIECKNYGDVQSSNWAAGILANVDSSGANVYFINCVNVGNVYSNNAQIAGISAASPTKQYMYMCRNYGNGYRINGDINGEFRGLTVSNAADEITNNFNISNTRAFSNSKGIVGNAYNLTAEMQGDSQVIKQYNLRMYSDGSEKTVDNAGIVINDDNTKRIIGNMGKINNASVQLLLDTAYTMDGLKVTWAGNNDDYQSATQRTYTYSVECIDKDGYTWYLTEDNNPDDNVYTWSSSANDAKSFVESSKKDKSSWQIKFTEKNIQKIVLRVNNVVNEGTTTAATYICLWNMAVYSGDDKIELTYNKELTTNNGSVGTGSMEVYQKNDNGYCIVDKSGKILLPLYNDREAGEDEKSRFESSPLSAAASTEAAYTLDSLSVANFNIDTQRFRVYSEVDPYVIKLFERIAVAPLKVKDLAVSNAGGIIKVTWNDTDKNYKEHRIEYVIKKDGKEICTGSDTIPYGVNNYRFDYADEWAGGTVDVKVYTVGYGLLKDENGNSINEESEPAEIEGKMIYAKEITPQAHVELVYSKDESKDESKYEPKYVIVWDNMDEYKDGTVLSFKVDGSEKKITKEAGGKNYTDVSGIANDFQNNKIYKYYVIGAESRQTSDSTVVIIQSFTVGKDKLSTTDNFSTTTFEGFYGDDMTSLYYSVKLQGKNNAEYYFNTEFVLQNYTMDSGEYEEKENKVQVNYQGELSVADGVTHVTNQNGSNPVMYSRLSNLPDDVFSYTDYADLSIELRAYPFVSQSYMTYFGHIAVQNISETDLKAAINNCAADKASLMDKKRVDGAGDVSVFVLKSSEEVNNADNNNKTVVKTVGLNEGYSLRRKSDGTYDIIYNVLAVAETDGNYIYDKHIQRYTFAVVKAENGSVILNGSDNNNNQSYKIQETPVLSDEFIAEGNEYTAKWTHTKNVNNTYMLQLNGIKEENGTASSTILSELSTADEKYKNDYDKANGVGTHTFVNEEKNWKYTQYNVKVTSKGTVDNNGKTQILPATANKTYMVKIQLSQITQPTVNFQYDENGIVLKNDPIYNITFPTVPEDERMYVGSYIVSIVDLGNEDKPDEAKKEDRQIIISREVAKTGIQDENLEEMILDDKIFDADMITTVLDFGEYTGGHKLSISVKAVAMTDDQIKAATQGKDNPLTVNPYRDSIAGVATEMTVPARLKTPLLIDYVVEKNKGLIAVPVYTEGEAVSKATLEKGITITLYDSENMTLQGNYQIAAAIYDEAPVESSADDNQDDDKLASGAIVDYELRDRDAWKSDIPEDKLSEYLLIDKDEDKVLMDGNFQESNYVFPNLAEHAGRWIKIAVRSISASSISSYWTDEDSADAKTVNYQWIHIPRMKLETPILSYTDDHVEKYTDNEGSNINVAQKTVTFDEQAFADCYVIKFIYLNKDSSVIYLEKTDDGYDVFVRTELDVVAAEDEGKNNTTGSSTDGSENTGGIGNADSNTDDNVPACTKDAKAVFIAHISSAQTENDEYVSLGLQHIVSTSDIGPSFVLDTFIKYNKADNVDEMGSFELVTPDVNTISDISQGDAFRMLERVLVQADVSSEEMSKRYAASDIDCIHYIKNTDGTFTEEKEEFTNWLSDMEDVVEEGSEDEKPSLAVDFCKDKDGNILNTEKNFDVEFSKVPETERDKVQSYLLVIKDEGDDDDGTGIAQAEERRIIINQTYLDKLGETDASLAGQSLTEGAATIHLTVDLTDFGDNHRAAFYVKAIGTDAAGNAVTFKDASGNDIKYIDGNSTDKKYVVMPINLKTPQLDVTEGGKWYGMSGFTNISDEEGQNKEALSLEMFENGLTIEMTSTGNTLNHGGYQINVAIYDSKEDTREPSAAGVTGNGESLTTGDTESESSIAGKVGSGDQTDITAPVWYGQNLVMNVAGYTGTEPWMADANGFLKSTYTFTDLSEYAGKWLRISVRAVSFKDSASENTDMYKWIQIPKLILDEPQVSRETDYETEQLATDESNDERNNEVTVKLLQDRLLFKLDDKADKCKVRLLSGEEEKGIFDIVVDTLDDNITIPTADSPLTIDFGANIISYEEAQIKEDCI